MTWQSLPTDPQRSGSALETSPRRKSRARKYLIIPAVISLFLVLCVGGFLLIQALGERMLTNLSPTLTALPVEIVESTATSTPTKVSAAVKPTTAPPQATPAPLDKEPHGQ